MKLSGLDELIISRFILIVKYFCLFFAMLFSILSVVALCNSITLPYHPELNLKFEAGRFNYSGAIGSDKSLQDKINQVNDNYCTKNDAVSTERANYFKAHFYKTNHTPGESEVFYEENNRQVYLCAARMSEVYGVKDIDSWSRYYGYVSDEVSEKTSAGEYDFFLLTVESMRQYQQIENENISEQRDFSVNYIRLYFSGALFLLFVVFSLLLILIRIEHNTRE